MKKFLMIATAALALTAGASTLSSPADAGARFHLSIGGYGHGSFYGGYNTYYGGCYTKYKKVRVKVYDYYGWHWEWIVKPIEVCY